MKLINDNATLLANQIPKIVNTFTVVGKDEKGNETKEFLMDAKSLRDLTEANDKIAVTLKVADRHAPKIDITQQTAVVPQLQIYAPEKDEDL